MSDQTSKKPTLRFSEKPPEQQLVTMIRYREHRKQKVKPEYDSVESPDDFFMKSIIKRNLVDTYLKDPLFDVSVHSERQNTDLIPKN